MSGAVSSGCDDSGSEVEDRPEETPRSGEATTGFPYEEITQDEGKGEDYKEVLREVQEAAKESGP